MKTAYQHTKKGQSCFLRAGLLMLLVLFCSVSGWAAKQESIKKRKSTKASMSVKTTSCKLTTVTGTLRLRIGARAKSPSVS